MDDLLNEEIPEEEPIYSSNLYLDKFPFYKNCKTDLVWWVDNGSDNIEIMLFSFDKKKVYNLFSDYPDKLTDEEVEIFDNENPYWANFFSYRKMNVSKIKDFDDIPYHGDPYYVNPGLPKGFRGNEKKYLEYLKEHNIDASSLSREESEAILREINKANN